MIIEGYVPWNCPRGCILFPSWSSPWTGMAWQAEPYALHFSHSGKKILESRRLSVVFSASQGELCLKKFQSAKVRLNTMETQNEIALYKKYSCNKMEIHLFLRCKCPEDF